MAKWSTNSTCGGDARSPSTLGQKDLGGLSTARARRTKCLQVVQRFKRHFWSPAAGSSGLFRWWLKESGKGSSQDGKLSKCLAMAWSQTTSGNQALWRCKQFSFSELFEMHTCCCRQKTGTKRIAWFHQKSITGKWVADSFNSIVLSWALETLPNWKKDSFWGADMWVCVPKKPSTQKAFSWAKHGQVYNKKWLIGFFGGFLTNPCAASHVFMDKSTALPVHAI